MTSEKSSYNAWLHAKVNKSRQSRRLTNEAFQAALANHRRKLIVKARSQQK